MPSARVILQESIWRRKWIFYYLVIPDFPMKGEIDFDITPEFEAVTFRYAKAYVEKGEMPPADIAPAILNMADDLLAGRQIVVRAGDYIAVQNHLRAAKK